MSLNLKMALIILVIAYIVVIIKSIKKKRMDISFSVFWLVIGIVLIIGLLIPNLIENITYLLGFETPSNMIFFITTIVAFCLILNLTMKVSKENKRNTVLVQELSILKAKIEEWERSNEK